MVDPAEGSTAVAEKTEEVTAPAKTEPTSIATEGAKTEPKATEPQTTEPKVEAKTEPAKTEPAKTEPAKTEPVKAETNYELKAPEGNLLTKDYVAQFQKDAIAAGLSKDEAQDLLDTQVNAVKDYDARTKTTVEQAKKQWRDMSVSDKEIGGDNFNRTAELSRRVVDRFGNDAFKKLLNETGFGNYPEVLRFLSKVGSAFSEDQLKAGSPSSGGVTKSREEILFGSTTPA